MAATIMNLEDILKKDDPRKRIEKPLEVQIDLGNLILCDRNSLEIPTKKDRENFLLKYTENTIQTLMDALYQLPVVNADAQKEGEEPLITLPEPKTLLPREKPVPKPKEPTKWEKFAQLKGIQKKKKGRMIWDPESQQYRPRWGYKSKDATKSWLLEVPENADPNEDQFDKLKKEKKERIAKNELQRLRNISRATKGKVPGVGLTPTSAPSKSQLETALAVTHKSTASLGQFMEKLPKERIKMQKKRKFEGDNISHEVEQTRQKKILKKIAESTPVVDTNRAANAVQQKEERERAASKRTGEGVKKSKAGKKGGKGGGGKRGGKGGGKSFGGKGKKSGGKKRR